MAPARSGRFRFAAQDRPPTAVTSRCPAGGNEQLILNTEARIPLPIKKGLGLVVFYDGGNVFPTVGFHDFASLYTNSVGLGCAMRRRSVR
jgi:outer membrane protein assembly factor BamA